MSFRSIALIGLGEVGQALAEELLGLGATITAFDLKFADETTGPSRAAARLGIVRAPSASAAVAETQLVISAVTAAQTVAAASSVAAGGLKGQVYLDLNSAAPSTKRDAAAIVEAAGGRFIEAAVMSPIHPKRLASPILLGGPHAEAIEPRLVETGFSGARFYSAAWGKAAATKLCRSVMIKGMEALISESLLAARFHGVEDEVLGSLGNLFPHPDWEGHARYMIARTLEHGARRAEEMAEAAVTVRDAGLQAWMSEAIVARQAWAPRFAEALGETDLKSMLDTIIRLDAEEEEK